MKTPHPDDLLLLYWSGELDSESQQAAESLLARSPKARAELEALQLWETAAREDPVAPPARDPLGAAFGQLRAEAEATPYTRLEAGANGHTGSLTTHWHRPDEPDFSPSLKRNDQPATFGQGLWLAVAGVALALTGIAVLTQVPLLPPDPTPLVNPLPRTAQLIVAEPPPPTHDEIRQDAGDLRDRIHAFSWNPADTPHPIFKINQGDRDRNALRRRLNRVKRELDSWVSDQKSPV